MRVGKFAASRMSISHRHSFFERPYPKLTRYHVDYSWLQVILIFFLFNCRRKVTSAVTIDGRWYGVTIHGTLVWTLCATVSTPAFAPELPWPSLSSLFILWSPQPQTSNVPSNIFTHLFTKYKQASHLRCDWSSESNAYQSCTNYRSLHASKGVYQFDEALKQDIGGWCCRLHPCSFFGSHEHFIRHTYHQVSNINALMPPGERKTICDNRCQLSPSSKPGSIFFTAPPRQDIAHLKDSWHVSKPLS